MTQIKNRGFMKYALILVLIILGGCAALPLFIEDIGKIVEIEEEIKENVSVRKYWEEETDLYENSQTLFCLIEPWKDPQFQESPMDFEKFQEFLKNYSDYYNYHFGPEIG